MEKGKFLSVVDEVCAVKSKRTHVCVQCVELCCSFLQFFAFCCSVLQCIAV